MDGPPRLIHLKFTKEKCRKYLESNNKIIEKLKNQIEQQKQQLKILQESGILDTEIKISIIENYELLNDFIATGITLNTDLIKAENDFNNHYSAIEKLLFGENSEITKGV